MKRTRSKSIDVVGIMTDYRKDDELLWKAIPKITKKYGITEEKMWDIARENRGLSIEEIRERERTKRSGKRGKK